MIEKVLGFRDCIPLILPKKPVCVPLVTFLKFIFILLTNTILQFVKIIDSKYHKGK